MLPYGEMAMVRNSPQVNSLLGFDANGVSTWLVDAQRSVKLFVKSRLKLT